jgi:hypothetical protein
VPTVNTLEVGSVSFHTVPAVASASDVFSIHDRDGEPNSTELNLGNSHVIDMVMSANRYDDSTTYRYITDRLRGDDKLVFPTGDAAESTGSNYIEFDRNSGNAIPAGGWGNNSGGTSYDSVFWMWKRARGYFDMVAYTGTGSARTVSHNLGVVPEMIWVKNRDATENFPVYHKGLDGGTNPETHYIRLNQSNAEADSADWWNDTAPTASVFTVASQGQVNTNNQDYIAYLFATVAGVSKVGSYTGNGSTQTIDCGFTSGARFVMIKKASGTGHWRVIDSTRGLAAGNDKIILLNQTNAETTDEDNVDPDDSGFALPNNADVNSSGDTFIFYAIA